MKTEAPQALAGRAAELRKQGRQEEAVAALQAALKTGKAPAWARAVLGEVLREMGSRLRGYGEIQKAMAADPAAAFTEPFLKSPAPSREDAWALACRAGALRTSGDLAGALDLLRRALELDPDNGWIWGWHGELLCRQNELAGAVVSLNRAVALFPEWPEAWTWRGEALRLSGDAAGAARDLDHAVALGYRGYEVFLSRASARLALGRREEHDRDMRSAIRAAPEIFSAKARELGQSEAARWIDQALSNGKKAREVLSRAKAELEKGRWESAAALAAEAARVDPEDSEAWLVQSTAREKLELPEDALRDAERAVRVEPGPATYARRAELAQKLGYMEAALKDLSVALALAPGVQNLRWRAQTFLGMRHYDLALQDLGAALELEPDDAALHDLRAHVNLILGRVPAAEADVERALSLVPDSSQLMLRKSQILALQGRFEPARRALAPLRRAAPAWAAYGAGYIRCLEKNFAAAVPEFDRAVALSEGDDPCSRQAALYGTLAKAFAHVQKEEEKMKKPKPKAGLEKGRVYLCGLGVYPPQTATVEVLRGITECDVIFNNLPGLGMSEFLGLFCANRRPVAFRYEQDAQLCADLVLSEVRAGRTVGFVTFGHPLLFGPLSHEIIKRCRKDGIPWKAFGAVSSMDALLAASGQVLGYSYRGYQLFETTGESVCKEVEKANPNLPIIVYFADGLGEEGFAGLMASLSRRFSPKHQVQIYGPKHELWDTQRETFTLKALAAQAHHRFAQSVLFVPPLGEN